MRNIIDGDDMFFDVDTELPETLQFYIPEEVFLSPNSEEEIMKMAMLMMMPTSPTRH